MSALPPLSPPQLHVLQSLLVAGHRPIQFRPGSLVRWGLAFALLALTTDPLLRALGLDGQAALQAGVAMLWLGGGLAATATLDWRANLSAARQADETLPFVQTQVSKVWWLLLATGVVYTGSTIVFGGAYQVYMVWLALVGLGLFLHGLFAHELVEWAGAGIFLLAILVLASNLPVVWHRPLVISTAGLGMPLLGALLHWRVVPRPHTGRLFACVAIVLAASVLPALLAVQWSMRADIPSDIPVWSQQEVQQRLQQPGASWPRYLALHVAAGTPISLQLDIRGNVLRTSGEASALAYTMAQDLDLLLIDGKFSHYARRAGEDWQNQDQWLRITRLDFIPDLGQASGLHIQSQAQVELGGMPQ